MNHFYKTKKRCLPKCTEHQFILAPQASDCWIKSSIQLDYCPAFNDFTYQYENIVPTQNFDRQPCLPAFILEVDRTQYQFNIERYHGEHQTKIDEAMAKKKKLYLPKPGKKHRYCGVCKRNYDEYLDEHIGNFHSFRSVNLIKSLIVGYQNLNQELADNRNTQSTLLFCDSNTKLPINTENFVAYFDQERISARFPRPLHDAPQLDCKIPHGKRGKQKLVKIQQDDVPRQPAPIFQPTYPQYPNTQQFSNPLIDFYFMQQQFLQVQQHYKNIQPPPPQFHQPQFMYYQPPTFADQMLYYNQYRQQIVQNGSAFAPIDEAREQLRRQKLCQNLLQYANNPQTQQGAEFANIIQNVIEPYDNKPKHIPDQ